MNFFPQDRMIVKWRAPLVVMVAAITLILLLLWSSPDFGYFAALFLTVPLAGGILILFLIQRRGGARLVCLSLLCFYAFLSWQILRDSEATRLEMRWALGAKSLKSEVMSQPTPADGMFRHIDWDGWGFAGVGDTEVYLVFDPNDSLHGRSSGRFAGITCEVPKIWRMENHWYAVKFYTETSWGQCQ